MAENMDNKISIGFQLENEFGELYTQGSTVEVVRSCGETDIDVIGDQLNCFLRQCGYVRHNDNIFMEDVTDEEYDALEEYLAEIRGKKSEK